MRFAFLRPLPCLLSSALGFVPCARASIDVGLSSASYLGQGPESRQKNYSSFSAGVDFNGQSSALVSRARAQGLMSFNDSDYRFVEAPELYVGTHPWLISDGDRKRAVGGRPRNYLQFTAGRKLETWNQLDQHWGLGAWQPRFRWDYLSPQAVGLIGLQAAGKVGPVQATLLYSPLFVPDRGAPIDFADGRMRSSSPWALNPPDTAVYRGRDTQIRYSAEIPDVMDVVQHHSVSGQIRVGEATGAWSSVAMAYKPMNQLPMGFDPFFVANKVPNIEVKIYPRITYHTLYSMDAGWTGANWDAWGSFLVDVPHDDYAFVAERVNQNLSRMALFSPTYTYYLGNRRSPHAGRISASYLKRFGEDQADVSIDTNGRKTEDNSSAFDSRYPYAEAVLLNVKTPSISRFTVDTRVLFDVVRTGTIVSWNVNYQADPRFNVYVGADVLTSWSDQDPDVGTDFIYRYRANDRVMGGFAYVF